MSLPQRSPMLRAPEITHAPCRGNTLCFVSQRSSLDSLSFVSNSEIDKAVVNEMKELNLRIFENKIVKRYRFYLIGFACTSSQSIPKNFM